MHSRLYQHNYKVDGFFYINLVKFKPLHFPNKLNERLELGGISEEEGFEPPVPCGTSVFKTDAFGHSATLPKKI